MGQNSGFRGLIRAAAVVAIAMTISNCSQQKFGRIDPKYGVAASPKVIRDGDPVPKGGGRNMVGKPYVVAGRTYVPSTTGFAREGLASWYGSNFHGRLTANGEVFDRNAIAAAHTTMPLPSYARVTNTENGRSIIVRVNDRGPYHGNRVVDVSERAAEALDFRRKGTARVRLDYVGRASPNGSDDRILLASLTTDGTPASLTQAPPTLVAKAEPKPAIPRTAVAFQQPEDSVSETQEVTEEVATIEPAGEAAAAEGLPSPVASVPLPPERPFDLGTIPNAATPVAVGATPPVPPVRPVVASLY